MKDKSEKENIDFLNTEKDAEEAIIIKQHERTLTSQAEMEEIIKQHTAMLAEYNDRNKRISSIDNPNMISTVGAVKRAGRIAATVAGATLSGTAIPLTVGAASLSSYLLMKYLSLPVNKKIEPVKDVSPKWEGRPKANIIKWLMQRSGISIETLAEYLGCSVHYLNNKLNRDSFSFDDLILAAYACGFTFVLMDNNEEAMNDNSYRIDLLNYFKNDEAATGRISRIADQEKNAKRVEYEKKKAELERMKTEYGFDD